MAEFNINGRMSVKNLKKQFKEAFGASLRVYNGKELADDDARLASLRGEDKAGGEISLKGNTKVLGLRKKMDDLYGIRMEVYDFEDKTPVDDSCTLASISQKEAISEKKNDAVQPQLQKRAEPSNKKETKTTKSKSIESDSSDKPQSTPAQGFSFDQLMNAVLVDGVVTDKERAVLLKKAVSCGYDADEVEIMIDAKIAENKKKNQISSGSINQMHNRQQLEKIQEKKNLMVNNKQKANKLRQIGETDEAIKLYKAELIERGPDSEIFKALFEIYYSEKSLYAEAIKYGTKYVDRQGSPNKDLCDAFIKEIEECLKKNRKTDARRVFEQGKPYIEKYYRSTLREYKETESYEEISYIYQGRKITFPEYSRPSGMINDRIEGLPKPPSSVIGRFEWFHYSDEKYIKENGIKVVKCTINKEVTKKGYNQHYDIDNIKEKYNL